MLLSLLCKHSLSVGCESPAQEQDDGVAHCGTEDFEENRVELVARGEQRDARAEAEHDQRDFMALETAPTWNWIANSVSHAA